MTYARIYQPAKTAMQSGVAKTHKWLLEFEPKNTRYIDPLMGWAGTRDNRPQVRLKFRSLKEAEAYAKKYKIPYHLGSAHVPKFVPKSYGENFPTTKLPEIC